MKHDRLADRHSRTALRPLPLAGALMLALAVSAADAAGGQRNQDRMLAEIRAIQAQLSQLTESQTTLVEAVNALLRERGDEIRTERQERAETRNTLDRLERDVSTLSEAFTQTNRRLSELMAEVQSLQEAQERALLAAVASGDDGSSAAESADVAAEAQQPAESGADASEGDSDAVAAASADALLGGPSISDMFLEARADYVQGRYELAFSGFEQVAASGSELADNARYFMGEVLLAQEEPEAALEQFEIVTEDFRESPLAADAWYKRGVVLKQLGHESDAREIFEDILEVFPGTQAARLARRELDALPEPG